MDEIYYIDKKIIFGNIVLTPEVFKVLNTPLPEGHGNRAFFFKHSSFGKKYKMIFRRDANYLINAETEYSEAVFKPVIDYVNSKNKVESVLLLGLGTGELIYKIKEVKPNCHITVIEVRSELEKYKDKIYNGNFDWLNFSVKDYEAFKNKLDKYDIIIDDITFKIPYKLPFIKNNLHEDGAFIFMANYKVYDTPYNFMAVNYDLTINRIDDRIPENVIEIYEKTFQEQIERS